MQLFGYTLHDKLDTGLSTWVASVDVRVILKQVSSSARFQVQIGKAKDSIPLPIHRTRVENVHLFVAYVLLRRIALYQRMLVAWSCDNSTTLKLAANRRVRNPWITQ